VTESGVTTTAHDLPSGWTWTTLGEISDKPQYGWTTKANPEGGTVKLLRTTDITSGSLDWSSVPHCSENPDDLAKYLVQPGDIVISRAGSVGFSFLLSHVEKAVFASYLIRFRVRPSINKKYIAYYLKSPSYWRAIGASQAGIAVPNVNAKKLERIQIPLAPPPQQKRIVAEIEKQFSRLDEAVASLKRTKVNLKRYKAAVLKAAVEGKLTEDWRKQHMDVEPASRILERILADRHAKWIGKKKFVEPVMPATSSLPNLQSSWAYASVEQLGIIGEQVVLTGPFGTSLGREDFRESGVPLLTISCLKETGIDLAKAEYVSKEKAKELGRYRLRNGDLLFSRMAAVGRAGIAGDSLRDALFNYHIMRLRLEPTVLMAKYYLAYVRGSSQVEDYIREVNHGATRDGINTKQLLSMPVALPPFAEQQEITAEVERRLSVVEELEATVEANLTRVDRLRQATLQKAFSGKLLLNGART